MKGTNTLVISAETLKEIMQDYVGKIMPATQMNVTEVRHHGAGNSWMDFAGELVITMEPKDQTAEINGKGEGK